MTAAASTSAPAPHRPLALRLTNAALRLAGRCGIDPFRLEPAAVLAAACRKTGLDDFGEDACLEGLAVLLRSADREAGLHPIGRLAARRAVLDEAMLLLRFEDHWRRHPQLAGERIREPLFIVGLPRTGTTALYGLLAEDPSRRAPTAWEVKYPLPPPSAETFHSDSRIAECQRSIDAFHRLVPDFDVIHLQQPELPEECQQITLHVFESVGYQHMLSVPSYREWLLAQDFRHGVRFHRRFLQYLQAAIPGRRWLLKSPGHFQYLPMILEVYPDACIVQTHRDPAEVMASISSLTWAVQSAFSDVVRPERVGREQLEFWDRMLTKCLQAREDLRDRSRQFFDIDFGEFVRAPLDVIARLYDHFGWELTQRTREGMQRYLERPRPDSPGKHRYSPEMFGLDRLPEPASFALYRERFGIHATPPGAAQAAQRAGGRG